MWCERSVGKIITYLLLDSKGDDHDEINIINPCDYGGYHASRYGFSFSDNIA